MTFSYCNGLKYYHFQSFDQKGIVHGFFSRQGGVSPEPWASLNLGGTNGDSRDHVIENRKRIFDCVGRKPESIFDVWQVHGTDVICAEHPRALDAEHQKADIIITNRPEVTLLMRFADCVPILLFDPIQHVVGLVHAGWMGTVKKAVSAAVMSMEEKFSCQPRNIHAGIGPSIGPDHYTIGDDVIQWVRRSFGNRADEILINSSNSTRFDLWRANEILIQEAGVEQIEVARICTACENDDWYSHRAEYGMTGRFGVLIALD